MKAQGIILKYLLLLKKMQNSASLMFQFTFERGKKIVYENEFKWMLLDIFNTSF